MIIGLDGNEANVKNRVGSGRYAFELINQFSKNKKHTFQVFLKVKPLSDMPRQTSNFKYSTFGPQKMWTQVALPVKLLMNRNIDVFFTLGHYGPRFSNIPFVITIHDLSYLRYPELFKKNDLYQLTNWTKYSVNKSSHIIAVSESTKDDIIKYYNISSSKISTTYEGYSKSNFKPQSIITINKILNKYNISKNYIIFVGTLQPRKNVEKLIEALTNIKEDIELVIVGQKGWLYDSIFQKVKELNLDKRIIFTDYVPESELPALLSGAKAYVLPSLWEGFGIPVVEAQACQVPVIVSDTSSLPEVVGSSGIAVDPKSSNSIADGINKVLNSKELADNLVDKGNINIKRFSWEKCASKTLAVLEKVASQ